MITNEIIANNICAERNRLRLSQEEVAEMLGISRDNYANLENHRTSIKATTLYELRELFGCKLDDFFILNDTTKRGLMEE